MEILEQLKEELGRLYIAGSKNAINDPRIKKYIPILEKLGEKSKIFLSLKNVLVDLVEGDEQESYTNLTKVYTLVNSVLTTQISFSCESEKLEEIIEKEANFSNILSYKKVKNFIADISEIKNIDEVETDIINTINNDFRLYSQLDVFLGQTYRNEKLENLLYKLDKNFGLYLLENYDYGNTVATARKLKFIYEILKEDEQLIRDRVLPLAMETIDKKQAKVVPTAIEILGENKENEPLILEFAKGRKDEYVKASLIALFKIESKHFYTFFEEAAAKGKLDICIEVYKIINIKNNDVLKRLNDILYTYGLASCDKKSTTYNEQIALIDTAIILSIESYDDYKEFYERLFSQQWLYEERSSLNSCEMWMNNLISNDIRYNEMIFNKFSKFLSDDKNSAKIRKGLTRIIFYYLIVIKNLFTTEKVEKLSMEFLSFCKDEKLLASYFISGVYFNIKDVFRFLGQDIKVNKKTFKNRSEFLAYKEKEENKIQLANINQNIFKWLFNDTYYFQNILGIDNYSFDVSVINTLNEYLEQNKMASKIFLDKVDDFIFNHIEPYQLKKPRKLGASIYSFNNLLFVNNEEFARLYFSILDKLYVLRGYNDETKEEYKKEFSYVIVSSEGYKNGYFNKYSYLLDKEFSQLKFLWAND